MTVNELIHKLTVIRDLEAGGENQVLVQVEGDAYEVDVTHEDDTVLLVGTESSTYGEMDS